METLAALGVDESVSNLSRSSAGLDLQGTDHPQPGRN